MRLFKRMIKPVILYPDSNYQPKHTDLEPNDIWYPEDEEEQLRDKYKHIENTFEHVVFDERYVEVEAYVLMEDEVKALKNDTIVWLQNIDKAEIIPGIFAGMKGHKKRFALFITKNKYQVFADMEEYMVRWRCWTSRPTEEQRKGMKWE